MAESQNTAASWLNNYTSVTRHEDTRHEEDLEQARAKRSMDGNAAADDPRDEIFDFSGEG
jgi:hypothetical protein